MPARFFSPTFWSIWPKPLPELEILRGIDDDAVDAIGAAGVNVPFA